MGKTKRINPEQLFFAVLFIFMFGMTIYRNSRDGEVKNNEAQIKPTTNVNDTTRTTRADSLK